MIWIIFAGRELWTHYSWIYPLMYIISFLVVLGLVSKDENPSYKTVWIIVIYCFLCLEDYYIYALEIRNHRERLEKC